MDFENNPLSYHSFLYEAQKSIVSTNQSNNHK